MRIYLQTINKFLRWTGFRLAVYYWEPIDSGPIALALRWYGWGFLTDGTLFNSKGWLCVDGKWERQ